VLQLSAASEPSGLPELLAERGFAVRTAPRAVQLSHVDLVAAVGDPGGVRVSTALDEEWFAVVGAVNATFAAEAATARALLAGVTQPSAYAVLTLDGAPAAAGRAVLDGRWLGIFNMATLPAFRQRGAARAVLAALAEWGSGSGAVTAYLQLEADNDAAPRLYHRAGFTTCYDYAYWSRNPAVTAT
jgi:ribosomal protein S18 acetylase RimI-like enzyme